MMKRVLYWIGIMILPCLSTGENGYDLWLRYKPLPESLATEYKGCLSSVRVAGKSPVLEAARAELELAMEGMTGIKPVTTGKTLPGGLVMGPHLEKQFRQHLKPEEVEACGPEGYILRTIDLQKGKALLITGTTEAGVLYGVFTLIRMMQTGKSIAYLDLHQVPAWQLRLLNHWDNLNGTVERGYAGRSIWWNREEDAPTLAAQYKTYARANASVGINGAVLNNVNASPAVLHPDTIRTFAFVADQLRPYHIKVYMAVNFSSPALLGGLPDSDPLNPAVIRWWKDKVKEIYTVIPDFGGFLVKANSEGQPGPQNYGRTHADGANMLAEALKPYNGVVMWRAFVYEPSGEDRAKQAYKEFVPLDGKFDSNVIIQVKNGPVDFQPREPFSPLFGAMKKSSLMVEFQITQEYLGFSDHLVYLAPLQKECLDSDTWCWGKGSSVARVTDGSLFSSGVTAIAGVANTGRDTNWCGHHFAQANWYAFGRLAWNHQLTARDIAQEWLAMTFTPDPSFTEPVLSLMMRSREAAVSYMTPLGLHHLMGWSHHYGPEPWTRIPGARPDWLPAYYHNASPKGIGFDRSPSGSNAVDQYHSPLKEMFGNPQTCPLNLLLWFHHLPWNYPLSSGRNLWEELCFRYQSGVEEARQFQIIWDNLEGFIDQQRFSEVQYKLKIQTREAAWWKDACLLYFQTFSGMSFPHDMERPVHDLDELKKLKFNLTHHN